MRTLERKEIGLSFALVFDIEGQMLISKVIK